MHAVNFLMSFQKEGKKESGFWISTRSRHWMTPFLQRKMKICFLLKKESPSAIVMSLVETAKANNLNDYKYLYTLLLYMPDYKNEPAGIEQLLPWSTFVQDKCSGIIDDSLELPENRGNLPI